MDHLNVAMLHFRSHGTIHEHAASYEIDVICLEGRGMTSLAAEEAKLEAGQRVRWPASVAHRLWTEDDEMTTLMIEHLGTAT